MDVSKIINIVSGSKRSKPRWFEKHKTLCEFACSNNRRQKMPKKKRKVWQVWLTLTLNFFIIIFFSLTQTHTQPPQTWWPGGSSRKPQGSCSMETWWWSQEGRILNLCSGGVPELLNISRARARTLVSCSRTRRYCNQLRRSASLETIIFFKGKHTMIRSVPFKTSKKKQSLSPFPPREPAR